MLSFNEDSGNVVFSSCGMDILNIDLNSINLNYYEVFPKTIIHVRLSAWNIKFENPKHLKER